MIYLVTRQQTLFGLEGIKYINEDEAYSIIEDWAYVQYDSETTGRDPHLCSILCAQFGDPSGDIQIVVDTTTVDIKRFKRLLETKFIVGQNLKFDLQFLYNHGIIPRKVYDTMIVEQFLHLGYPSGSISYSLAALGQKYLGEHIDKSVRGQIIWRGLDSAVVQYAANDVKWLGKIMDKQLEEVKKINAMNGAKLECDFVPAIAYLEWCGIMLDEDKWKEKMKKDKENLANATEELNNYCMSIDKLKKYIKVNNQLDLFESTDLRPYFAIDWQKKEALQVFKDLGFNLNAISKTTGKETESVLEKNLKVQKGIDDKFLELYFKYQEYYKVTTSFGQGHLNAVNPITGRIHTNFKQLGAASGRMSCGGGINEDLAKYKKLKPSECPYVNLQQLPADDMTRSSFVAPEDQLMVSADFSAEESRLGADIYQDKEFLKEFKEGSGDTHSLFAWMVFRKECENCGCTSVSDVKKKAPQWRKLVKAVEFAYMFGAEANTIAKAADCSVEEAQKYIDTLNKSFYGMAEFAKKGSQFVRTHGYIVINPITGHRLNWWDFDEWNETKKEFTPEFWDDYRANHKGTGDNVAQKVKYHFQTASKYDRLARNVVTQGTGAIIMKDAMTSLFNWIVESGLFNMVHICCSVHDEIVCDYPANFDDFPKVLETIMETSASKYCKSLPIPAEASVGSHWIH